MNMKIAQIFDSDNLYSGLECETHANIQKNYSAKKLYNAKVLSCEK
jgi:hypothetical protein